MRLLSSELLSCLLTFFLVMQGNHHSFEPYSNQYVMCRTCPIYWCYKFQLRARKSPPRRHRTKLSSRALNLAGRPSKQACFISEFLYFCSLWLCCHTRKSQANLISLFLFFAPPSKKLMEMFFHILKVPFKKRQRYTARSIEIVPRGGPPL